MVGFLFQYHREIYSVRSSRFRSFLFDRLLIRKPNNWWGNAKYDETTGPVIPAITCCENVYARPLACAIWTRKQHENSRSCKRRQVHLSPLFEIKKQTCPLAYKTENGMLESPILKLWTVLKSVEPLSTNGNHNVAYKVVITMLIGPLDEGTYCARPTFTHLGMWRKMYDFHCLTSQPANVF